VWDQDIRVIVMLTAESEGGQLKCHPYWSGRDFGPIKLRPLSEKKVSLDIDKPRTSNSSAMSNSSDAGRRRANTTTALGSSGPEPQPLQSQSEAPFVVIRKFALSHAAHPFAPMREITHLYYPSWPDFGAPAQPSHLLALVELANVMQRAALPVDANAIASLVNADNLTPGWYDEPESDTNSRPILVHCSAGCGRTGTFCTVDSVIDMMKRQHLASMEPNNDRDADGDVTMEDEPKSTQSTILHGQHGESKKSLNQNALSKDQTGGGTPGDSSPSWMTNGNLDLVADTVEDFRGQRLSMVQSLRQFVLCYETVLEWVWRFQEKNNSSATKGRVRSGSLEGRT
jgi:tyrosine-protein phosphatase 2/3